MQTDRMIAAAAIFKLGKGKKKVRTSIFFFVFVLFIRRKERDRKRVYARVSRDCTATSSPG